MTVHSTAPVTPAQSEPASPWPKMFRSLEEPNFRIYLIGMALGFLPMSMKSVAQGYLAFTLTGSATALGVVSLSFGLPQIVLTMFAGVIADRYPRRVILTWTQLITGVTTFFTAILIHAGLIEVWHLVVISLVQGAAFAFNMPSRQGLLPDIIGERNLTNAVALNNSSSNLTRILGPALAGGLIAVPFINIAGVYDLMAICYVFAMIAIWQLKIPPHVPAPRTSSMVGEIGDALRYIRRSPVLSTLMLLAFVPILLGTPYQTLMPVFAVREMDAGSAGLGLLMTAVGAGALAGSLTVAALSDIRRKSLMQLIACFGFGLALTAFALSRNFTLALFILPFVGALQNMYMALNNTLIMMNTERRYIGRVLSIYMMTWSINPVTTLPISFAVDQFGAPDTVAVLGVTVTVVTVIAAFANPRYRTHATR